jgi:hypothetical protein
MRIFTALALFFFVVITTFASQEQITWNQWRPVTKPGAALLVSKGDELFAFSPCRFGKTANGDNWEFKNSSDTMVFSKIIRSGKNNLFVAGAVLSRNTYCGVYTSMDGVTWSEKFALPKNYSVSNLVADSGEKNIYLFALTDSTSQIETALYSSSNLSDWKTLPAIKPAISKSVCQGAYLVVFASSGQVFNSKDGQTWGPAEPAKLPYINNVFQSDTGTMVFCCVRQRVIPV